MNNFAPGLFDSSAWHRPSSLARCATILPLVVLYWFVPFSFTSRAYAHEQPEMAGAASSIVSSEPVEAGYRDFSYGSSVYPKPTSEKPESKLWWNDGRWWGCLWDSSASSYRIHRFDVGGQSFTSVGPNADNRTSTLCDALSAGSQLYIASHMYGGSGASRLYGYDYDGASRSYSLRAGFPVDINDTESETLTIDRDTTGKIWAAWEAGGDIWVNRSLSSDTDWGEPFVLPVQGGSTSSDDICAISAFDGRVGIVWSNQSDRRIYFATHLDGEADLHWEPREEAVADDTLGQMADDHLNVATDANGCVYVVSKTSLKGGDELPRLLLSRRTPAGDWTTYVAGTRGDDHTRPSVLVDDENRKLYVFAKSDKEISGAIRMKVTDLDDIAFEDGPGELFIHSDQDHDINDPSSTKQSINSTTGLLVIASDAGSRRYLHNYVALAGGPLPEIAVSPSSYDYGEVLVTRIATHTFQVHNVGTATLQVESTAFTGPDARDFRLESGGAPFHVAAGATHDLVVRFNPSTMGPLGAILQLASTDPAQNPLEVPLAGRGILRPTRGERHVFEESRPSSGIKLEAESWRLGRVAFRIEARPQAMLRVAIYDVRGRLLRTLRDGPGMTGSTRLEWDGQNHAGQPVSSGIYFVRAEAGRQAATRKVTLFR